MRLEVYAAAASLLVGLGVGSALHRRSIVAIVMSLVTAVLGIVILMVLVDRVQAVRLAAAGQAAQPVSEGAVFGLCLGVVSLLWIALGCSIAYRRLLSGKTSNVCENIELRR